jgi:hypothetical protein
MKHVVLKKHNYPLIHEKLPLHMIQTSSQHSDPIRFQSKYNKLYQTFKWPSGLQFITVSPSSVSQDQQEIIIISSLQT